MRVRLIAGAGALAVVAAGLGATPARATPAPATTVPGAFAAAAGEFKVPEPLLLAYSYSLTGWRDHAGRPSAQGGYGLMHLTSADAVSAAGRGSDVPGRDQQVRADPALNTLTRAARLLGEAPEVLRTDETENIRGGAALLADEARQLSVRPARLAQWYQVVQRLGGGSGSDALARDVFTTLQSGAEDARLRLAPQPEATVPPAPRVAAADAPECPAELACKFVPAAYATNNIADANAYGNYDPADRPAAGTPIKYIVIHDTESTYESTVNYFQNPTAYTSSHYVIRSSDGEITQMVRTKDIAWHAGNSLVNDESIGIEHEGVAAEGATWFTDAMYRNSARLVRYLARRFHIPLDRQHIIGHDDVANQKNYPNSHWDPGPFWDWNRYMTLLNAPAPLPGRKLVTVDPEFATNQPTLTYCPTSTTCQTLPAQPSSTVLLRTAPSADAPLLTDPVIGGGTTKINDWSNKTETGRRYAVAERQGDWTAIWFGGQKAWLPTELLRPTAGLVIRPRAGVQVPVFPANLPEPGEWPAGTPAGNPTTPPAPTPLYTISGEQSYQVADRNQAEIYYARYDGNDVPYNHTVIWGAETYYRISFNHRFMYVRASDVEVR